jgi:GH18 family chitinase
MVRVASSLLRALMLTESVVNFAFALIDNAFNIIEMSPGDTDLWVRTTALKQKNPALKVFLSIGGWSFNDPVCYRHSDAWWSYAVLTLCLVVKPTQHIFSQLVGSDTNIAAFIRSALSVLESYGFDGLGMQLLSCSCASYVLYF